MPWVCQGAEFQSNARRNPSNNTESLNTCVCVCACMRSVCVCVRVCVICVINLATIFPKAEPLSGSCQTGPLLRLVPGSRPACERCPLAPRASHPSQRTGRRPRRMGDPCHSATLYLLYTAHFCPSASPGDPAVIKGPPLRCLAFG